MFTTRFAPSPTGYLHVGNIRTALFNYVLARQSGGQFILRIDDTDKARSEQRYIDAIYQDLEWLGLVWDRTENQSNRLHRYYETAEHLQHIGKLYGCFETPVDLELKRKKQLNMGKPPIYDRAALALTEAEKKTLLQTQKPHWRFLLDHQRIEWEDLILGHVSIDAASISDPVLIRADEQLLYTLASVVDDTDMNITHVVRGNDHTTNTAVQIQIMRVLDKTPPQFAHHSLLVNAAGENLSKRLGALSIRDLRANGLEPITLLSYLSHLGRGTPPRVFADLAELVAQFDINEFSSAPAKFDTDALPKMNAEHLQSLSFDRVRTRLAHLSIPDERAQTFWLVLQNNISTLDELDKWYQILERGTPPMIADGDRDFVKTALALLPPLPFSKTTWHDWTQAVKQATGRKGRALFMPLRCALTGQSNGPDMADLMPLIQSVHRDL